MGEKLNAWAKELEARDRAQRQETIRKQLAERRKLQTRIKEARTKQQKKTQELNRDVARYMVMGGKAPAVVTRTVEKDAQRHPRNSERNRDRGPDFEL